MEYMLSTHELGKLLSDLCNKYEISMLWREKISGGFITLTGKLMLSIIQQIK